MRRTDGAAGATGSSGAARLGRLPGAAADVDDLLPRRGARAGASLGARLVGASAASALRRAARAAARRRHLRRGFGGCGALRLGAAAWRRCCLGRAGAARSSSTAQDRLADLHLVAGLDLDLLDLPGHRRRHFDRGLVGLELEDRLILRDRVARLDEDAQHVAASTFSPSSGSVKSVTTTFHTKDTRTQRSSVSCALVVHRQDVAGFALLRIDVVRLDRLLRRPTTSILPSRASAASVATTT